MRETGGEFEKILGNLPNAATNFNSENTAGSFDTRSDNKGPEPEGVTVQAINGKLYAFVTLERAGGVMVYDVTDPANASFVSYEPPGRLRAYARYDKKRVGPEDDIEQGALLGGGHLAITIDPGESITSSVALPAPRSSSPWCRSWRCWPTSPWPP